MPSRTTVVLPKEVQRHIAVWAEKAYPKEGCGLLIGRFSGNSKNVVRLAELTNHLLVKDIKDAPTLPHNRQGQGSGGTEFVMSPDEFNRETLKAEKEGLDVVGVIHTHPDHPARPSAIDSGQPFLAQWSNIIVSVEKGKTKDLKSWFRETDDVPFEEETVQYT